LVYFCADESAREFTLKKQWELGAGRNVVAVEMNVVKQKM
jgi:hypothetical protein